ncbi:MAG: RluA family pseudouridine synthase [Bacilli bacterium]|nr:RluA family pseudouridine synthase [Bacilli bacterium]
MDKIRLIVETDIDQRIDKYLNLQLDNTTRSQIQLMIAARDIKVNNEEIKASYKPRKDDIIDILFKEKVPMEILPEPIPLDIYYEDSDIIVINKPRGLVVHPATGNYSGTLVNALLYHSRELSNINGIIRAGIVHRIDKDTSGLIVACKNDEAHRRISMQFKKKMVLRIYEALTYGVIDHDYGRIDAPIGRHSNNRKLMSVVASGKPAITHFQVIERFAQNTWLELKLETGRTHQIRVHLQYIGYPVVGDPCYGLKKDRTRYYGQFLHAKTLGLYHPCSGEYMQWEAPLPEYFQNYINELRSREQS